MKEAVNKEWLVTDQRGAFAMGTPEGFRKRKYHGFFAGIAGRSQTAFLTDLDFNCNGVSLWPHSYKSPEGIVIHPDPETTGVSMEYKLRESGPQWKWSLKDGVLKFTIEPAYPGGISLHWRWLSNAKSPAYLRVRGFWGMRDLHAVGGQFWEWKPVPENQKENKDQIVQIQNETRSVYCLTRGGVGLEF